MMDDILPLTVLTVLLCDYRVMVCLRIVRDCLAG
jgi:hypothetical protein